MASCGVASLTAWGVNLEPSLLPPTALVLPSAHHIPHCLNSRNALPCKSVGCGILRCREFEHLGWETQGIPAATMSDILRCHDWNYVRSIANVGATGEAWLGLWGQVWE